MPAFNDIRNTLYDWAFGIVTPEPVIWADQNAPRPAMPYLTLRITPSSPIGQDYQYSPKPDGTGKVTGNREFTLMIQHFGAGGYDAMEALGSSLERFTIQQMLNAGSLAYVQVLPTLDISMLVDTRFEERYSKDVIFRTHVDHSDIPGFINRVIIDGEIQAQTVIERTVDINTNP